MTIEQMQQAIADLGWQWKEHIFNDGKYANCMIQFTQDKSPHALSAPPYPKDSVGWGRYRRQHAWEMAYAKIVEGVDTKLS